MTEHDVETESEPFADVPTEGGAVSPCYQAYVERNEHGPDRCTIYAAVDAESVANTWIRAAEGAFVSREDVR